MYRVIKAFTDLQDKNHRYSIGDQYPRSDLEVPHERIIELSGIHNKRGIPLITMEKEGKAEEEMEEIQVKGKPKNTRTPGKKDSL